jgi:hypothetical protein
MERSILKELTKVNVEAYVNRQREQFLNKLYWQQFFPLKYTTQLTWESLAGSGGNPVMADVIEYNSSAPLKTRRTVTKTTGDIPKIAIKRQMDEKDMNDYNILKALSQGDTNRSALLDIVFDDINFCYSGVMARTEYLAMQALSYGAISLTTSNNNGIVTEVDCDFGIPAGNKSGASVIWSNASGCDPMTDIATVQETARAAGYPLGYICMDRTAVTQMLASTKVQDAYSVFQGVSARARKTAPTFDDLNNMLGAYLYPKIIIVDSQVKFESNAHALTSVAAWKTGYATFIPDVNVGNVLHGPIAEETAESVSKKSIQVKRDHVLISKWSELEPFGEFTKAQANAFPRFNDVNGIFLLNTLNATTFA